MVLSYDRIRLTKSICAGFQFVIILKKVLSSKECDTEWTVKTSRYQGILLNVLTRLQPVSKYNLFSPGTILTFFLRTKK